MSYPELMIDIETMGPAPDGAVLAIGAVPFAMNGTKLEIAPEEDWFNVRITLEANVRAGRKIDGDTIEWWLRQDRDAQVALLREPRHTNLDMVMVEFCEFVEKHGCKVVWAKPPSFDLLILRHMFGADWPFHWRDERCVRTVLYMAKTLGWKLPEKPDGIKHDAAHDAYVQAKQVTDFVAYARRVCRPIEPKPQRMRGTITVGDGDPVPFFDGPPPMMGPGELGVLVLDKGAYVEDPQWGRGHVIGLARTPDRTEVFFYHDKTVRGVATSGLTVLKGPPPELGL